MITTQGEGPGTDGSGPSSGTATYRDTGLPCIQGGPYTHVIAELSNVKPTPDVLFIECMLGADGKQTRQPCLALPLPGFIGLS